MRCQLSSNPWLLRNGLRKVVPWLGAVTLVMLVQPLIERTGLYATLNGQYVGLALILPILVGGLVLTVRQSLKKEPVLELEIDPRELRVRNLATGAITFTAPLATLTCARGVRRYTLGRAGTFQHAVLAIASPGQKSLSIGVADARFSWADASSTLPAPRYVVGPPSWIALAEALGVHGSLRPIEAREA